MNKLKLDLEAVRVESFAIEREDAQNLGTVRALEADGRPVQRHTMFTFCPTDCSCPFTG